MRTTRSQRSDGLKQLFFIVGVGRSGSTLLSRQIEPHPRVALTREARVLDVVRFCSQYASLPAYHELDITFLDHSKLYGLVDRAHVGTFAKIFHRHALEMMEEFYRVTFAHKDFTHWGDKLPLPETAIEMQQSYPDTKYVVLMRDPRDVCCSLRSHGADEKRHVEQPLLGEYLRSQTIEDTAIGWRNTYTGLLRYCRDHTVIYYEELVRDTAAVTRRVFAFLGLEPIEAAGTEDDRQPFSHHGTSDTPAATVDRWRRDLTAEEIATVESICGELMQQHGYALSGD